MKVKPSPLHLLDYAITHLEFNFIPLEDQTEDIRNYFQQYDTNIDFTIDSDDYLRVFIKAEINRMEEQLPGYSLKATSVCIFQFVNDAELTPDIKKSLEGFSTIYIALNCLRGLLSNFTANAPYGRFILPSIDLNDLIESKKATLRHSSARKTKTGGNRKKARAK